MTTQITTNDSLELVIGSTDPDNNDPAPDFAANFAKLGQANDDRAAAIVAEQQARATGDTNTLTAAQAYADALMANRQTKAPCRFVTTANVSLSGLAAVPEGTPVAGDRI